MTLGALGGAVKPLTRAELIKLAEASPAAGTAMVARAFGVTEPVIRQMVHNGELEKMGVRVLRLGRLLRFSVADILAVLGIEMDTPGPAPPPSPGANTTTTALAKGRHDHGTSAA